MIVEDLRGTARAGLLPVRGLLEVESSACPRGLGVAVYAEPDPEPLMPYPEDFGDPDEYERAAVAWEAGYEAACDAARTALARGLAAAGLSPGPALRGANAAGLSYAMAAISDTGEPEGLLLFPAALWLVQEAPSVPEERRRALVAEAYTLWRCGEADAGNAELVEVAMRRLGWGG